MNGRENAHRTLTTNPVRARARSLMNLPEEGKLGKMITALCRGIMEGSDPHTGDQVMKRGLRRNVGEIKTKGLIAKRMARYG